MVKIKGKIFSLIVVSVIFVSQSYLLSAFEAHIVNVTAQICSYSQTRTMGYWKNHPQVYLPYLSQYLGDEEVGTKEEVDFIFDNADANEMVDMLKAQLLAMKFNIAYFGIDDYFVESEGKTLNQIVSEADELLRQVPLPEREVLERMKTLLDNLNNLHQIRYCGNIILEPGALYKASDQCLKINEVYYAADDEHGGVSGQWVELYNACTYEIDLWGWHLQDNAFPEVISGSYIIYPDRFAVIAASSSTYQYWPGIPQDALLIEQGRNQLFDGLNKPSDFLYLYDNLGNEVDLAAWGSGIASFSPPVPDVLAGHSIARNPKGYDTDKASDWIELEVPNPGTNPHTSPLLLSLAQNDLLDFTDFVEEPIVEVVEEAGAVADEQTAATTEPIIPTTPAVSTTTDATSTEEVSSVSPIEPVSTTSTDEAATTTELVIPITPTTTPTPEGEPSAPYPEVQPVDYGASGANASTTSATSTEPIEPPVDTPTE